MLLDPRHGCSSFALLALLVGCGGAPTPAAAAPAPTAIASTPQEPAAPASPPAKPEPAPAPAPDPTEVGSNIYKKVFDNDSVRMFEVTFKPGDKIALHRHPDHVVYVISGGKLRVSPATGAPQDFDLKAGQAMFLPAQEHSAENVGTTEVKSVVLELRKAGAAAPAGADPVVAGPTVYKKVFENERVRVLEVTFKKGAKIGAHAHPDHAVYVLEAGKLRIEPDKGAAKDFDFAVGNGVFLPAQVHSASNAGKTEVKAVVFELKPGSTAK